MDFYLKNNIVIKFGLGKFGVNIGQQVYIYSFISIFHIINRNRLSCIKPQFS